jgi:ribosomal protein L21E
MKKKKVVKKKIKASAQPKKIKKKKIGKVEKEYKEGELHSGSKTGPVVEKKDEAVAIAISEAKKSKKKKSKK